MVVFLVVVIDAVSKQAPKNDRKPSQNESKQMVILHTMTLQRSTIIVG